MPTSLQACLTRRRLPAVGRVLLVAVFAGVCLTGLFDLEASAEASGSQRPSTATLTATPTDAAPPSVGRSFAGASTFDRQRDAFSTGPMALLGLVPMVLLVLAVMVRRVSHVRAGGRSDARPAASRAPPVARLT